MSGITLALLNFIFFILLLVLHLIFSRNITIKNINNLAATVVTLIASVFFIAIIVSITVMLKLFNFGEYRALFTNSLDSMVMPLTTMLLITVAAIYYNIHFSKEYLWQFILYSFVIYIGGLFFILTNMIIVMFLGYELILLPTTLVIDGFSKTSKSREATRFMIVWTQLGAIMLFFLLGFFFSATRILGFLVLTAPCTRVMTNLLLICVFFGFAPKMPVWPFYWWLPEAHVEVPTSFSIVLSGVSIKFAFLGYVRFIELLGNGDVYWVFTLIAIIGLIDASLKLDSETDIKKIVAYQTVVEMHAFVAYVSLDIDAFSDFVMFTLVAHCWISTSGFILVDIISRRLHTRNVEKLYGVIGNSPVVAQIAFLAIFIGNSLPGTQAFSVELYIQVMSSTSVMTFIIFIFVQLFVIIWSKNIWWLLWGGDKVRHDLVLNLTTAEYTFLLILGFQSLPTLLFSGSWY